MTTVQLFGDIGLYNNYKQTINFATVTAQNNWFNAKSKTTISNVIYNKAYNSLKLNMAYGDAIKYSYCRLINLDNTGRIYYYFVIAVNVIDDATVEFILEMDYIQTYMTFWTLKESMVNRAHVDRWSDDSTTPIRITPNIEGINANYDMESTVELMDGFNSLVQPNAWKAMFMYIIHKTTADVVMDIAPFSPDIDVGFAVDVEGKDVRQNYPSIDDFVSNNVLTMFNIDPESVICMGISPIPLTEYTSTYNVDPLYNTETVMFPNAQYITTESSNNVVARISLTGRTGTETIETNLFITNFDVDMVKPVKPTNNADASDTFEPALYMSPYRIRYLTSPSGSINSEVPDVILDLDDNVTVFPMLSPSSQVITFMCGSNMTTLDYDEIKSIHSKGLLFNSMMDSMDVFNNAWLTYMLTQRDSDREILNNNAISSVLQGLLFGAYGGALVTSRGTGGKDKRSLGKMASRMVPGIALGGVASAGAAIIDSHFAWENQLQEERKIQNKAQTVSITGTNGAGNAVSSLGFAYFEVMKCDDTNYNRAYDNFRKYGYSLNQFMELNINSRKYYNYVMTNGAVIGGALPEDARDVIASAFDAGITIFHGDYCEDLTYPTKENIERSLMA